MEAEQLKEAGFESEELDKIFDLEDSKDIDDVPEVPKKAKSKLGEIYQLGDHRLMCGDSTKKEDVEKLMDSKKADMVFTDPPYGISAVTKSGVLSKTYKEDIIGDESTDTAIKSFENCKDIKKLVFWGANYYANKLPPSSCWLVWNKNTGESDQMDCELAWTNFDGVTRMFEKTVERQNRIHPTQKPVALIKWCFKRWNKRNDIVLDLFGGSGSTLIAAEQLNRKCYMMELDPKYCDIIIKRYEAFAGQKAKKLTK